MEGLDWYSIDTLWILGNSLGMFGTIIPFFNFLVEIYSLLFIGFYDALHECFVLKGFKYLNWRK